MTRLASPTLVVVLAAVLTGGAPSPVTPAPHRPAQIGADTLRGTAWTDADWHILEAKVRWAVAQGLDTVPVGTTVAKLGESFVGAPYRPGTLEIAGPERLVVDLREFDCVTFVEHMLALARFVRQDGTGALANPAAARARYEQYLQELRYRDGVISGYPSRLHYFSDWLADHERRGMLHQLGDELHAATDIRPIAFMSTHASAYRQLADADNLAAIRDIEAALTAGPGRRYVPKAQVRAIEDRIQDGDILAMTSALPGLDVAHTGIALRVDGRPRLLNAPLVGRNVELSPLPLAEHLDRRPLQTGMMVARMDADW